MSIPLPPSPRRHRGGRLVVVTAVAGLLLAAILIVLLYRPAPRQAPGPQPESSQQTPSGARVPAGTPGVAVSTTGWHSANLDGTAVPVSRQAGPRRGPWPLAAGFADTPAGAVLAAVNIAVRTSGQLGPAIFTTTISRQVTGVGGALLSAAWKDYAAAVGQHPPASTGGPAGTADASARAFRLTSWIPAMADVEVLAEADNGSGPGVIVHLQVQWRGGDWRLVAPPSGILPATAAQADMPDFTSLPGS